MAGFFGSISKLIFGGGDNADTLPLVGTFSDTSRRATRCLFLRAQLSLNLGSNQLVVTRVVDQDDDDGDSSPAVYPFDLAIGLRLSYSGNNIRFSPPPSRHSVHISAPFTFAAEQNLEAVETFFNAALRAIWSVEHGQPVPAELDDAELQFWYQRTQEIEDASPKKQPAAAAASAGTSTPARGRSAAPSTPLHSFRVTSPPGKPFTLGRTIEAFGPLSLWLLDTTTMTYVERCPDAGAHITALAEPFSYQLVLYEPPAVDAPSLIFPITVDMDFSFDSAAAAVQWRSYCDGVLYTWALRGADEAGAAVANAFRRALTLHLWQAKAGKEWRVLGDDEQAWILDSMADGEAAEPMDVDRPDRDDDEDFVLGGDGAPDSRRGGAVRGGTARAGRSAAYGEDDVDDVDGREGNSLMELGKFTDRAFVSRGASIGVFKYSEGDQMQFVTRITACRDLAGDAFSPSKMMLHQQDSSLLMLNPARLNTVSRMDLERGQIVEEYKASTDDINWKVLHMAPTTKFNVAGGDGMFVGLNQNSLFRMDPRLAGPAQRVDAAGFTFAANSKPLLSCVAATDAGEYVVGSQRGEIRLFSAGEGISKRPKTTFPGCGDPILGIDVTASGDYILATCETYLLLIPTRLPSEPSKTGFQKPLGKDKPRPIRLRLKHADVVLMGGSVCFRPARFDTTLGTRHEAVIATSTGPWLVCWSFARAARGDIHTYTTARASQAIVSEDWVPNDKASVVLTMPDDVQIASRPARASSRRK